jgi:hypothetical protein
MVLDSIAAKSVVNPSVSPGLTAQTRDVSLDEDALATLPLGPRANGTPMVPSARTLLMPDSRVPLTREIAFWNESSTYTLHPYLTDAFVSAQLEAVLGTIVDLTLAKGDFSKSEVRLDARSSVDSCIDRFDVDLVCEAQLEHPVRDLSAPFLLIAPFTCLEVYSARASIAARGRASSSQIAESDFRSHDFGSYDVHVQIDADVEFSPLGYECQSHMQATLDGIMVVTRACWIEDRPEDSLEHT